jgi:hypothetical protein
MSVIWPLSRVNRHSVDGLEVGVRPNLTPFRTLLYGRARNDGCHPVWIDVESQER